MEAFSIIEKKSLKKTYKNTLQGAVIYYIKKRQEVTKAELQEFIKENYSNFRTLSGSRYKGTDYEKILQGLLTDSIFQLRSNHIWLNV